MTGAARARVPASAALRDIQAPVVDRLNDVVAEMRRIVTHELPLDGWSRLPAALDALAGGAIGEAAARLFHPDELVIVVVGDRKSIEAPLRALPFVKTIELRDADGNLVPAKP